MSIIEEKCKQKGVRLTDQRKVIAKILSESKEVYGSKDHPDVDELHKRVTVIDDKISIATVYRTVKLFEEAGILIKHDFKAGKARYEINDDHNHLIDINSGEIVEFIPLNKKEIITKEITVYKNLNNLTSYHFLVYYFMIIIFTVAILLNSKDNE